LLAIGPHSYPVAYLGIPGEMLHKVVFKSHAPLAPLFILMIVNTIDAKFALFAGLKSVTR